jgi:hypothetical protein
LQQKFFKKKMSFSWDLKSATRKFLSNGPVITNIKPWSDPGTIYVKMYDPNQDAYRNCKICGRHINFHKDGKCPR